jgi:hypothetical protein
MSTSGSVNNNNDDDNDGIVDRLAKTLFASPNSPLTAFADRQRIERMEQCTQLANILSACQAIKAGKQQLGSPTEDAILLPPSRSAARISRFFKWNGEEEHQPTKSSALDDAFSSLSGETNNNNTTTSSSNTATPATTRPRYSTNCAIETHELWACRALAVGCGNHLADLRRCWDRQHSVSTVVLRTEVKDEQDEGIEFYKDPMKEDHSCRTIQMNMARCVNRHVAELNERQTLQKTKKQ